MELPTHFSKFLSEIRLTDPQKAAFRKEHEKLRDRIHGDKDLETLLVDSFLQGSYVRATSVKPVGTKKPDVDVIVVTRMDKNEFSPSQAIARFEPFVKKHYSDWMPKGRSISIHSGGVDLDLVITAAPSQRMQGLLQKAAFGANYATIEDADFRGGLKAFANAKDEIGKVFKFDAKNWRADPLDIPDREVQQWMETHPLAQIEWTHQKNGACNGHFVNVVKAIKWWKNGHPSLPKYPKGYPLEHLVGVCCPDGIRSVAEGVTRTFETISEKFYPFVVSNTTPVLKDYGVNQNVLSRVTPEEFAKFHEKAAQAAIMARQALDSEDENTSVSLWHDIFGLPFARPTQTVASAPLPRTGPGFTPRREPTRPQEQRFA